MQKNQKNFKKPNFKQRQEELSKALGFKVYVVQKADVSMLDAFIAQNGGYQGLSTNVLKIMSTILLPDVYGMLTDDEIHFLRTLCEFASDLNDHKHKQKLVQSR